MTDYKLLYEAERAISATWRSRYDKARDELTEDGQLQDKIDKLEKELETADRTIWVQVEKLSKLTAETERLREEIEAERRDTRALITANAKALDRVLAERDEARGDYATLQTCVDLMPKSAVAECLRAAEARLTEANAENEGLRAEMTELTQDIHPESVKAAFVRRNSAEARVSELESFVTVKEACRRVSEDRANAAEARLATLTAENERLRAEVEELKLEVLDERGARLDAECQSQLETHWHPDQLSPEQAKLLAAEARLAEAQAENERLRAEETRTGPRQSADNFTARRAAEARLATAAGLLKWLDEKGGLGLDVHSRIAAFLASAQPAAPTFPPCEGCGSTTVPTEPTDLGNGPVMCVLGQGCWTQPAAPARAEAEQLREQVAEALELLTGVNGEMVKAAREVLRGRVGPCAHGQVGYCGACCLLDESVSAKPARAEVDKEAERQETGVHLDELDRTEAECPRCNEHYVKGQDDAWQMFPARAEAEQAVLDACAAWTIHELGPTPSGQRCTTYGDPLPIVRAELARREAAK